MEIQRLQNYSLFHASWQEGIAQAQQLYAQMDLDRVEDLGLAAGFTSKRPPRDYRWIYAVVIALNVRRKLSVGKPSVEHWGQKKLR